MEEYKEALDILKRLDNLYDKNEINTLIEECTQTFCCQSHIRNLSFLKIIIKKDYYNTSPDIIIHKLLSILVYGLIIAVIFFIL